MSDWRPASPADAGGLADLERDTNLVALAHVFGDRPFPYDDVLGRWVHLLDDPTVTVDVVAGEGRLDAFAAYDAERLRHLGVHPDLWGRGLGGSGVDRAVARGTRLLWVLDANLRARSLYERLGWRPTGRVKPAEFPPYPLEIEYAATEPDHPLAASEV